MSRVLTCFDQLGLTSTATEDDIKSAFRTLSKKVHPDHGGNVDQFLKLKRAYDEALDHAVSRKRASVFSAPTASGSTFSSTSSSSSAESSSAKTTSHSMASSGNETKSSGSLVLFLSLNEMYQGNDKHVTRLLGRVTCPTCTNSLSWTFCTGCKGSKFIAQQQEVILSIPPGTLAGETIEHASYPAIKWIVHAEPHPVFTSNKNDKLNLYMTQDVKLGDSLVGASIPVELPSGEVIKLSHTSPISNGQVVYVPGAGMYSSTQKCVGTLVVTYRVWIPKSIRDSHKDDLYRVLNEGTTEWIPSAPRSLEFKTAQDIPSRLFPPIAIAPFVSDSKQKRPGYMFTDKKSTFGTFTGQFLG